MSLGYEPSVTGAPRTASAGAEQCGSSGPRVGRESPTVLGSTGKCPEARPHGAAELEPRKERRREGRKERKEGEKVGSPMVCLW